MPTKQEFIAYCRKAASVAEEKGDGNTAALFNRIAGIAGAIGACSFAPDESIASAPAPTHNSGRLAEDALKNGDLPAPSDDPAHDAPAFPPAPEISTDADAQPVEPVSAEGVGAAPTTTGDVKVDEALGVDPETTKIAETFAPETAPQT